MKLHFCRNHLWFTVALMTPLLLLTTATAIIAARLPSLRDQRVSGHMGQYAHSPYWSVAFVDEIAKIIHNANIINYSSAGYTITNGLRLTTDQPKTYAHTIWLLGNSTVWGMYVADGWTIASYLQRDLNAEHANVRVVNAAQIGYGATQELLALDTLAIQPGDIVVAVDGAVDFDFARQDGFKDYTQDAVAYQRAVVKMAQYSYRHHAAWQHFIQPDNIPQDQRATYVQMTSNGLALSSNVNDFFDMDHLDDTAHAQIARQILDRLINTF